MPWGGAGGVYRDIASGVAVPHAGHAPNRKTLTASELRNVMDGVDRNTVQGMRDYAILALMLTAGLSALEISRANVGDVCEAGGGYVLHIRGSDGQTRDRAGVPQYAMEAISKYLYSRGRTGADEPLFMSVSDRNRNKNEHMSAGSVSRVVKNALRRAGYDDANLTAKSLKVSAMKLALQRGEHLEDVQRFARHRQIRTTFLYEHGISDTAD